jgi:hypothetical protein
MKLARLQKIFEEVQVAQNEQGGFGSTTPYSMLIEEMLKDSNADFCLTIAEKAIGIGRGKDGLRDRPEPVAEVTIKRGRRPKAQAIYGATDG